MVLQRVYTFEALGNAGRLGNQLFQIAGTTGRAIRGNGVVRLPPGWEYRRHFAVPDDWFQLVDRANSLVTDCWGYFQDLQEFGHIAETIREIFRPSVEADREVSEVFGKYGDVSNDVIVHVRRGDYERFPEEFILVGSKYYVQALADLKTTAGYDRCFVVSDEPDKAEALFPGGVEVVRLKTSVRKPEVLTLLWMCRFRRHVIANSTYSWWPAWLGQNNIVYCPWRWGPDGTEFQSRVHTIIPSHWLLVSE